MSSYATDSVNSTTLTCEFVRHRGSFAVPEGQRRVSGGRNRRCSRSVVPVYAVG